MFSQFSFGWGHAGFARSPGKPEIRRDSRGRHLRPGHWPTAEPLTAHWGQGADRRAMPVRLPLECIFWAAIVFSVQEGVPPARGGIGRQYSQGRPPLPCFLRDSLVLGVLELLPAGDSGSGRVGALVLRSADAASGLPPRLRSLLPLGWALARRACPHLPGGKVGRPGVCWKTTAWGVGRVVSPQARSWVLRRTPPPPPPAPSPEFSTR